MTTLRDKILAADDLKPIPIKIPEWGVDAFIRPLDGEARFLISHLPDLGNKGKNAYILEGYVCLGLVDKDGVPIFALDDRALLARKSPAVIERIYQKIIEASGIDDKTGDDAEKK